MIYRLYIGCGMYVVSSLCQVVPQATREEIGVILIYLLPEQEGKYLTIKMIRI